MRSAVYLSLALLLWPLMISALPLPSCLHSCEPVEPIKLRYQARAPDLGPLRRKARSAEELADANANPVPNPREDIVERAIIISEASMRRDVESALSIARKEGPKLDSRAVRTLRERWGFWPGIRKIVAESVPQPKSYHAGAGSTSRKRWIIPPAHSGWDIPLVENGDPSPIPHPKSPETNPEPILEG